jgi:uncharacterized membrane protein (UPF0127 family)
MIEIKVKKLTGLVSKIIGLLNAPRPYPVYFHTRYGIHTFGMKYPLDLVILDDSGRVVYVRPGLKPFRIYVWNPQYQRVLELPEGSVGKYGIKRGTVIRLSALTDR